MKTISKKSKEEKKANHTKIRNWKIVGGLVAILLVVILLANTDHTQAEKIETAVIGKSVGDFSLLDLDGNSVHLSDYKGKTVLINAWATWCPPCRAEMPDLEHFYQLQKDNDFVILAINAGDTLEQAQGFVRSNNLSFPVLLDPDVRTLEALGITGFPTSILIDPDGIVKYIHIGMFRPSDLELRISPFLKGT
jgi:peroxiredoxin